MSGLRPYWYGEHPGSLYQTTPNRLYAPQNQAIAQEISYQSGKAAGSFLLSYGEIVGKFREMVEKGYYTESQDVAGRLKFVPTAPYTKTACILVSENENNGNPEMRILSREGGGAYLGTHSIKNKNTYKLFNKDNVTLSLNEVEIDQELREIFRNPNIIGALMSYLDRLGPASVSLFPPYQIVNDDNNTSMFLNFTDVARKIFNDLDKKYQIKVLSDGNLKFFPKKTDTNIHHIFLKRIQQDGPLLICVFKYNYDNIGSLKISNSSWFIVDNEERQILINPEATKNKEIVDTLSKGDRVSKFIDILAKGGDFDTHNLKFVNNDVDTNPVRQEKRPLSLNQTSNAPMPSRAKREGASGGLQVK